MKRSLRSHRYGAWVEGEYKEDRAHEAAGITLQEASLYCAKGYELSVRRQQISAQTLLNVIEKIDKEFPVIKETYGEILYDLMDIERAKEIVEELKKGEIEWGILETAVPSPFAQNLIVLGEPDIILMKDRKVLAQSSIGEDLMVGCN